MSFYNSIERLPKKFKMRPKVEDNYMSSYVNTSFVHDDEIRRKSIELFYQMINHEIEQTSNIENVSRLFDPFLQFFINMSRLKKIITILSL